MGKQYNDDSVFTVKSQKGFIAKRSLLDAGVVLITDLGMNGFSVTDLCKKAGLKRTSFYSYFDSMDQFVDELSTRENAAFDTNFEHLFGEDYYEMTPGVKRLMFTLLQYFDIVESGSEWNRLVVELYLHHSPTAQIMFDGIMDDVAQGTQDGDFLLHETELSTYVQLILASLSISGQREKILDNFNVQRLLEMLLDAGRVKDKMQAREFIAEGKILCER